MRGIPLTVPLAGVPRANPCPVTAATPIETKASSSSAANAGGATYHLSGTRNPPAGLRLSPAEVVIGLAQIDPIANSDVRAATGLDRAEALTLLGRLVNQGKLVRTGQRRGAKYHAT